MSEYFNDEKYMLLCSEKTLQTNKEGFFLDFANGVSDSVPPKWLTHTFGKLKSDKDRIKCIYEDTHTQPFILEFFANVQEIYRKKCQQTAEKRLREALQSLSKHESSTKTLALLSQSVLKSPPRSEILATALFHRAKYLFSVENYTYALSDLQLAVKEAKFDEKLKPEAFWKMAICYKARNEENKAKVAFNLAEKLLHGENKLIRALHEDMQKEYRENFSPPKILPEIHQPHEKFKNASKKISVKNSPQQGNFVVANEKIQTGETIVSEEAYAACLLPEKFGTHCHHCFERLKAPLACEDCSSLAFCSQTCRNAAATTYHKHECKFLDLLIGSGMSILAHCALRMVTQHPLERSLQIYSNRSKEKICNLCANSSRRHAVDSLHRTIMAGFLLRILQKSGYFSEKGGRLVAGVPTEEELKVGEMLLYNLQMLQFNAHEIYETVYNEKFSMKARPLYIGIAVYPTVALFNHDCYPAVSRYFIGKRIVINALRPLEPNEVVAENYGPIFTYRNLIDRQRSLSARYWFNCQCLACTEDWPGLNSGLDNFERRIKCPENGCLYLFALPVSKLSATCPKCKKTVLLDGNIEKLKWCEKEYECGLELIKNEKFDEAIRVICAALDVFHEVSAPPHKETHLVQDALRWCLAKNGNTFQCVQK